MTIAPSSIVVKLSVQEYTTLLSCLFHQTSVDCELQSSQCLGLLCLLHDQAYSRFKRPGVLALIHPHEKPKRTWNHSANSCPRLKLLESFLSLKIYAEALGGGMLLTTLLTALLSLSLADAAIPEALLRPRPSVPKLSAPDRVVKSPNGTVLPPLTTVYYFDQLIDHNKPSLGTFKQRYWMSWEYYEAGGPIVLMLPGEQNADGFTAYLTDQGISGLIAKQQHGAGVILEHRFFGYSNPYDNLTSQSLELLTVQQAIDDLVYFAQHADLPMPGGNNVKPDTTPWILVGGSYSGALVGWTMVNQPGIFFAGYASSAVVEAITDFWGYFTPIHEYMPQNCSSDVQVVIEYLDKIYEEKDTTAMQSLKEAFGLGSLSHIDDFAAALRYNIFDWQALQPNSGPGASFFQFCDALEVRNGVSAPTTGWGLEHAIQAWGSFWNHTYYARVCGSLHPESCIGTYDSKQSYWTNTAVNNADRSWFWMVCNEFGFFQDSPPPGQPALISRILQPIYDERLCVNTFPQKFSSPPRPSASEVNSKYHGWNIEVDGLFFANGRRDPWREATVSASGLHKASTNTQPIYESDGFHCTDMLAANGNLDATVHAVQMAGLRYIGEWLV